MDLNLDTLKREILTYLEGRDYAVFRSAPGTLDGSQMVLWDAENYPDYQMFLEAASKVGVKLILFATREFTPEDVSEILEQMEELSLDRDQQRDYQNRLRDLRRYEGQTCSLELAFNHDSRLYVYELQPDWYEDFLTIEDEIAASMAEDDLDEGGSLGGYFSRINGGSRWLLPSPDPAEVRALADALRIATPAAKVLLRRGFADPAAARHFLKPVFEDLHDPLAMSGMAVAVERLARAIRAGERILIYGDYDVDGTTSVVLLTKAIELAGGTVVYHVPHRLKDGYGMRSEVIEAASAQGVKLIVSVDTGIRAAEVVGRANELGIDVIVTDHHLPESELPPALAVLNPNRPDCAYPEKDLCGAGVAFKLIQALLPFLGWPADKVRRVCESFLKMAAIATVADVVPLLGENRVIVSQGLRGLGAVRNPGLRALLDVAGFTGDCAPNARQVAFQIAPRMNAAGRMDTARAVVELFLTNDAARARDLAKQLHDQNTERQQVELEIREICEQIAVAEGECALVYYAEDWHRGVLGIVASRLVERLHRPVFVLSLNEEDGMASGSGRSIPAFHLLEALESMSDLFARFGGHKHAAGVTMEASRVPEFRERFNAYAATKLAPEDFLRRVEIDAVLDLREIDDLAIDELFSLAPFGHGNPAPLFAALNVEVANSVVWKDKHLKLTVRQNGRTLTLKAWNFAPRAAELQPGARVDVAFQIEEDAWSAARGFPPWCATLRDCRPA